jgi:hypothetical protein
LGIPFAARRPSATEVIDPEALLWCSLEFFPTQPRLCEQVLAWWGRNDTSVLRPRIRGFAKKQDDPKALLWLALDLKWKASPMEPTRPCYGEDSTGELIAFCRGLGDRAREAKLVRQQPGAAENTPSTTLLRARDAFGADARHLILVYLLASGGSATLRSIAAWSGQSYRNLAKVAQRWESAKVITLDHGYARLTEPSPWKAILGVEKCEIVLLNWQRFFEACLTLLRYLHKAVAKAIPADGPVIGSLFREAVEEAAASVEGQPSTTPDTLQDLNRLLADLR